MKLATVIGPHPFVLMSKGSIMTVYDKGEYWLTSRETYMEAIEFFTAALKSLDEAEEEQRKKEEETKRARLGKS